MSADRPLAAIPRRDLERAALVLAHMVHDEFPDNKTLAEICATWGYGWAEGDRAALRKIDPVIEALREH